MARAGHVWVRRGVLAAVLLALAFAPGQAARAPAASCGATQCPPGPGTVRWTVPLSGSWSAADELTGTVPNTAYGGGEAYAEADESVAAIGYGMVVYAYSTRDGHSLWASSLTGFPAGSQIVSVRVWTGVVAVGVASGPLGAASGGSQRTILLTAAGGQQLRSYPAAAFGGAVSGNDRDTVVVGPAAVTSYANRTGRRLWSRGMGRVQDWRSDGGHLFVAQAAGGALGTGPVTAVRQISLRTGAEQVIRPTRGTFDGRLSQVLRGVLLFSGAQGVTAYSASTGARLWQQADAVPESDDTVNGLFYLTEGSTLSGVSPSTGRTQTQVSGASGSSSGGVYAVRDGIALGLDLGALGQVWGYDVTSHHVVWNSHTVPWPHWFVDLSGIGGSTGSTGNSVLLTQCPQRVQTPPGEICQDPELVLVDR